MAAFFHRPVFWLSRPLDRLPVSEKSGNSGPMVNGFPDQDVRAGITAAVPQRLFTVFPIKVLSDCRLLTIRPKADFVNKTC